MYVSASPITQKEGKKEKAQLVLLTTTLGYYSIISGFMQPMLHNVCNNYCNISIVGF